MLLSVVLHRRGNTGMSDWPLMVFVHVSKQEVGHWCASVLLTVPAAAVFQFIAVTYAHFRCLKDCLCVC